MNKEPRVQLPQPEPEVESLPDALKIVDDAYAKLIELVGDDAERYCRGCGTHLGPNNTAYWIDELTCRTCACKVEGVEVSEALSTILSRGYLMIVHYKAQRATYSSSWRMRIEIRTSKYLDLLEVQKTLGGTLQRHGKTAHLWRWTSQDMKTLATLGRLIRRFVPALGELLIRYTLQPGGRARSSFAEAAAAILGCSTKLSKYVKFGG